MTGQAETGFGQSRLPARSGADGCGFIEQSMPNFLLGQSSESRVLGMSRCQEGFFAMQDGRVFAGSVIVKVDLPRTHIQFHAGRKSRMRIGLKVRIGKVRNLPRQPMQFDQIGFFNLTQVSPPETAIRPDRECGTVVRSIPNRCEISMSPIRIFCNQITE